MSLAICDNYHAQFSGLTSLPDSFRPPLGQQAASSTLQPEPVLVSSLLRSSARKVTVVLVRQLLPQRFAPLFSQDFHKRHWNFKGRNAQRSITTSVLTRS